MTFETKTAAIIGGGVIGGGWAARFLLNGWDVQVYDPDPEAKRKIDAVLTNARASLPALYDTMLPPEGTLTYHDSIAQAVVNAAWIQESVPERLDIKHDTFAQIQAGNTNAPIGSSTSGFKPSELQQNATNPAKILVAHPFNPVYLLPLIELVPSPDTSASTIQTAKSILTSIGLHPLHIRKEIDAHIADRFLEAVWREGLWLIKDGIATTEEIDNAIRYGFGLRWAQMGLFETYRIAGGEAGMAHFIAQFGPALKWPWTKLMDVPELTQELTDQIASQSDAQSGHHSIRDLERIRDDNLVAMIRALKAKDQAAGALIKTHEATLPGIEQTDISKPITTIARVIPSDWTDYNGHMNESRYGQVFSDAADAIMVQIGADADYIAAGLSYFTIETNIKYLLETHAGDAITVKTIVTTGEGKKLGLTHHMYHANGDHLASCDQFLLHVDLKTRKSCAPAPHVSETLAAIAAAHANLDKTP